MLSSLYWDMDVEPEQLYRMLDGETGGIGYIDGSNLYARLLATYDWYTLLKLIPAKNLKHALSDQVIMDWFGDPPDLPVMTTIEECLQF